MITYAPFASLAQPDQGGLCDEIYSSAFASSHNRSNSSSVTSLSALLPRAASVSSHRKPAPHLS
jgi:hypothetical protein